MVAAEKRGERGSLRPRPPGANSGEAISSTSIGA
jgi:hypothetical protein